MLVILRGGHLLNVYRLRLGLTSTYECLSLEVDQSYRIISASFSINQSG